MPRAPRKKLRKSEFADWEQPSFPGAPKKGVDPFKAVLLAYPELRKAIIKAQKGRTKAEAKPKAPKNSAPNTLVRTGKGPVTKSRMKKK